MRSLLQTLSVVLVGLMVVACGGTPVVKQPDAKRVIKKDSNATGPSDAAVAAFKAGVASLEAKPAKYTAAAESFAQATSAYPDYTIAWLNLAYSYERLGRHKDSADAYRKLIEKKVNDRGVTLALGRALLLSGEPQQAITEFESVLREKPDDLQARNNLAAAYLAKNDLKTSLRYVKEVLAVQPKNVPAIVNLGLIYLQQKKLPLALLMFNKALGYEKKNARAHNNLGLTFYAMDNIPRSVLSFETAVSIDPTMDEARLNLASVYLDYLDYTAALKQFELVRERFPKHYQAMVGQADSLYGTGEYETSAKLYEESLTLRDNNPEVLLRVGKIYEEQLGKPKAALPHYLRFREVAKPAKDHPIHQTIQFLEQMDKMKEQSGAAAPAGDAPAGDAPAGDAPAGDAPAGDAPAGDAPAG
ncbi:MAG: tetratricopeptide (TPR) repeat protein, partial [Bradymonadia bacterium]